MKDIGRGLEGVDTLTWSLSYEKTKENNIFLGKAELAYIDTSNYKSYFGLKKISNKIEYKQLIDSIYKDLNIK